MHPITGISKASGATFVILLLEGGLSVFIFYLFLVGVRFFSPVGEKLHCNRSTMTLSNIPWVSLRGRWNIRSFPLAHVSELMYGVIRQGNTEKNIEDVYGLSFYACEKEYKIFGGLAACDADDITRKLRSLGVDVIINQDMSKMINKNNQEQDPIF